MVTSRATLEAALRVLCAINTRQKPTTADVDALVKYTGLEPLEMPLDEFACKVVQDLRREGGAAAPDGIKGAGSR